MFNKKRLLVFLLDISFIAISYTLAFLIRFDFDFTRLQTDYFRRVFFIVLLAKSFVFLFSKMYRSIWSYASLHDAFEIVKTVMLASVVAICSRLVFHPLYEFSRGVFIIDFILLLSLVASSRLLWRIYREKMLFSAASEGPRTLIVGAGEAGSLLFKEIRKQAVIPYNIIGFVDDDGAKHGMNMHGLQILGSTGNLGALVRRHKIEKVIIAMPSAGKKKIRDIVKSCEKAKVRFKTLPGITELINGSISMSTIKDVEIEDLLGRDPVVLDEEKIRLYLTGKRVLVSGAAGSIGSEICRQVAMFAPRQLVLLDNSETPLFYIERELTQNFPELRIIPIMADVRNSARIERVFEEFLPEVVFHAAAYKHVPMMEYNPQEAVSNNIGGTKNLADAAARFGCSNFVMISTDKAVNPTNVMGASKRAAEVYVQALAGGSRTNFTTVRFGNVLGSNGSVIPLFKEQLKKGGPLTVTDPQVTRYFMTIPEASQLVLQAGCLGKGGEIFVLDMGESVRIVELAEQLIRLSGLEPYDDIDIVFTGLRPGEKMFEELLILGEGVKPTVHPKIKVLQAVKVDLPAVNALFSQLFSHTEAADVVGIMQLLRTIVPEFRPAYHFNGAAPAAFRRVRRDLFPLLGEQPEGTDGAVRVMGGH